MRNDELAKIFDEIADMLEIRGDNFYHKRAYRLAADGTRDFPEPIERYRAINCKRSPSILLNSHDNFDGRKVGVLVSDGLDADLLKALRQAVEKEGAMLEIVAPRIGGIEAGDGSWIEANQTISGGPSVLYDALALLVSDEAIPQLINDPSARDFIADAYAYSKFVAYARSVLPLLKATLGDRELDEGFIEIKTAREVTVFLKSCRQLRFWKRHAKDKSNERH